VRKTVNPFAVPLNGSAKTSSQLAGRAHTKEDISKQITAYLVTKEIRRSHPVLRVLFYASELYELRPHSQLFGGYHLDEDTTLCAAVIGKHFGKDAAIESNHYDSLS